MTRFLRPGPTRGRRLIAAVIAAAGGFAAAALVGVALAKSFTVQAVANGKVTNQSGATKTENIAGNSRGFALYTLSGDSRSHPKCTKANGCVSFWPPLTVASAKKLSKGPGIRGKLAVWHHDGSFQVTLAGHPLYRYAADRQRHDATGEGVRSFGGIWHVVSAAGSAGGTGTMPTTTTTTMTTTTTTSSCAYPPCY
jgi:predicted lipoprotein with Yx(FWY)xxD motif